MKHDVHSIGFIEATVCHWDRSTAHSSCPHGHWSMVLLSMAVYPPVRTWAGKSAMATCKVPWLETNQILTEEAPTHPKYDCFSCKSWFVRLSIHFHQAASSLNTQPTSGTYNWCCANPKKQKSDLSKWTAAYNDEAVVGTVVMVILRSKGSSMFEAEMQPLSCFQNQEFQFS